MKRGLSTVPWPKYVMSVETSVEVLPPKKPGKIRPLVVGEKFNLKN